MTKANSMTKVAVAVMCVFGVGMSSAVLAGGITTLPVTAKVSGKCNVTTGPGTLDFGTIDPSSGSNATATQTFVMKCSNGTVSTAATDDGGLHNSAGQKQMVHSANGAAFLPYGVTYSNDTGFTGAGFGAAAASQTVTINGTITPAQFSGALATTGAQTYNDTVTITVNP